MAGNPWFFFGRANFDTHTIHVWCIDLHEWLIFMVHVGKYTIHIHGSYGTWDVCKYQAKSGMYQTANSSQERSNRFGEYSKQHLFRQHGLPFWDMFFSAVRFLPNWSCCFPSTYIQWWVIVMPKAWVWEKFPMIQDQKFRFCGPKSINFHVISLTWVFLNNTWKTNCC